MENTISAILWPRHEVLQLVLPQLAKATKDGVLSVRTAVEAVRNLVRLQDGNGNLSYDSWVTVCRKNLRWNTTCSQLFWEMLVTAICYVRNTEPLTTDVENSIKMEYVAIFLAMHISEPKIRTSPHSLQSQYTETMWPSPAAVESESFSNSNPTHSLSSPSKLVSPKSPRSPKKLTSPQRKIVQNSGRTTVQYLHLVGKNLPIILSALSHDDCFIEELSTNENSYEFFSPDSESDATVKKLSLKVQDFGVSRRTIDSLGLIIGGGFSREEETLLLSNLHPFWSKEKPMNADSSISFVEISAWLEQHLSVNEVIYPRSPSPASAAPSPSSRTSGMNLFGTSLGDSDRRDELANACDGESIHCKASPCRHVFPLSLVNRLHPTAISHLIATTYFVVAISSPHGSPRSTSSIPSSSSAAALNTMKKSLAEDRMSMDTQEEEEDLSEYENNEEKEWTDAFPSMDSLSCLPICWISDCSQTSLYLLCPYSSVTISNCQDVTIVLGAVGGAVVCQNCERVRISVACRKLVVSNCVDCEYNIATLTASIISSDCENLSFGPFNISYRHSKSHLLAAQLSALLRDSWSNNVTYASSASSLLSDRWSELCFVQEVVSILPALGSPSGYAVDLLDPQARFSLFPSPPETVAYLQSKEQFSFLSIPYRSEYQPPEMAAILPPNRYWDQLMQRQNYCGTLQNRLQDAISSKIATLENSIHGNDNKDLEANNSRSSMLQPCVEHASPFVKKRFLDWVVRKGKMREVLDLIRLDALQSEKNVAATSKCRSPMPFRRSNSDLMEEDLVSSLKKM